MANSSLPTPDVSSQAVTSWTSWSPFIVISFVFYLLLCSNLRFRRREAMHKKYRFPTKESLSMMTNVEAQEINAYMVELEFPKIYEVALQFALFRTYGIPTISKLLVATKELTTPANASKRYADTAMLIAEFTGHHPHDERALRALARMNFIHSQYQKAGKISNDDLLYTLSLFVLEPPRWVGKYEWRSFTDMETCAVGTLWKSIGDAMGIQYKGSLAHSEWADGLDFFYDIRSWSLDYEAKFMVPALTNKQTADETVPLLLFYIPNVLKPIISNLVCVVMGTRLREAMMFAAAPTLYHYIATTIFGIRRIILRYFTLPRPDFMRVRQISDKADSSGRYFMTTYQAHPYYNKPGFWNRWGPQGWFVWLSGGDIPGSKGDKYIPQGYIFEEVGPKAMKNKGMEDWKIWEEKVKADRPTGCPMAFAR